MGEDRILCELIDLGADPHAKNILGLSFADIVPQYEKIRANLPLLRGETKSAITKPNYFGEANTFQSDRLIELVNPMQTL
jgi:hypothetical protein